MGNKKYSDSEKAAIIEFIDEYVKSGKTISAGARAFISTHPECNATESTIRMVYTRNKELSTVLDGCDKINNGRWTEEEYKILDEIVASSTGNETRNDMFLRAGMILGRTPINVKFHYYSNYKVRQDKENAEVSDTIVKLFGYLKTKQPPTSDLMLYINSLSHDDLITLKAQVDAVYFMKTKKSVKIENI